VCRLSQVRILVATVAVTVSPCPSGQRGVAQTHVCRLSQVRILAVTSKCQGGRVRSKARWVSEGHRRTAVTPPRAGRSSAVDTPPDPGSNPGRGTAVVGREPMSDRHWVFNPEIAGSNPVRPFARVAHLGERVRGVDEVERSSRSASFGPLAQFGRASASQVEGSGFESRGCPSDRDRRAGVTASHL
jgi:hypothetical protein